MTTTRVFAPYDRSGAPTAGVVAHRSGSCFTTSITVAAKSAYRCFAADTILDPCFLKPHSKHLLDCYSAPWSHPTQLRVAKLPAASSGMDVTRPWAIQLAGGVRCVVTNGTAAIVRGVALSYRCPDGAAGLRTPTSGGSSRSHAAAQPPTELTALYRATDGAIGVRAVVTAWRTAG